MRRDRVNRQRQQMAVDELAALLPRDPYQGDALDLFLSLRLELEAKQPIDVEEQELIIQLSPLYLEKIEAAKQEGETIGAAKGEAKGAARTISRQLHRRLGEVPDRFLMQIQQLTVPQLEDLGEALLDFTGLADLEHWLGQD